MESEEAVQELADIFINQMEDTDKIQEGLSDIKDRIVSIMKNANDIPELDTDDENEQGECLVSSKLIDNLNSDVEDIKEKLEKLDDKLDELIDD